MKQINKNRRLILLIFFFFATGRHIAAQDYTNGVFILNEDWYGHNNSTLNFLNPETGEFDYCIVQGNADNAGLSLGCTAQFGAIYGDNMYIISKQDQDPGEQRNLTGGRVVVLDAKTMKIKKSIPVIAEKNGKSVADGRSFVGVNETKGYIGTSNGIYILDLTDFEIKACISGSENPRSTGEESPSTVSGALYYNQIGMMIRTYDYVFAVQQDKGILVINPEADTIAHIIEGRFGTMTRSKDGTLWAGVNSNSEYREYPYGFSGENWKGDRLLKINPSTLETEIIDIPVGGINQTWYAWTAGSLCAGVGENVLYFTFNENKWNWFTTSKMYRYDIDGNKFTEIYDSQSEGRYFYGASIRVNPADDNIYAALYVNNASQIYFIYQMDGNGHVLKVFEPVERYWFPAMFIFPDSQLPGTAVTPVPADNRISIFAANGAIRVAGLTVKTEVQVFNLQGQLVRSQFITGEDAIQGLPAGLYIVKAGNKQSVCKLIIDN